MPKYVIFYMKDTGDIRSFIRSRNIPACPDNMAHMEVPPDFNIVGRRVNVKTGQIENAPKDPESLDAFSEKYPTVDSIVQALRDPDRRESILADAEMVKGER